MHSIRHELIRRIYSAKVREVNTDSASLRGLMPRASAIGRVNAQRSEYSRSGRGVTEDYVCSALAVLFILQLSSVKFELKPTLKPLVCMMPGY